MKEPSPRLLLMVVGSLALLLASCAGMPPRPPTPGEFRLVGVELPEEVREGAPYDAVVRFKAKEKPQIHAVCVRWLATEPQRGIPPLYCYMMETRQESPLWAGSRCWATERDSALASPYQCVDVDEAVYNSEEGEGTVTVTLNTEGVYGFYRYLESYVQYIKEGQPAESNRVSTSARLGAVNREQ